MKYDRTNYILKYWKAISSGRITANEKILKIYEQLAALSKIKSAKGHEWHFDVDKASRPIYFVENFCRQTKGAGFAQPLQLQLFQKAAIQSMFGIVDAEGYRKYNEVLWIMGRKNGKALALDTEIPTPTGWKLMKDVHVGDAVFGQDGKPSTVIAESEIFHKPMYAVTFEDGSVIKASGDHTWTVQTKESRKISRYIPKSDKKRPQQEIVDRGGWFERSTDQLATDYRRIRADGKGVEYKYRVPMAKAVEHTEKDLPIPPYTLGVWLGDGYSRTGIITCGDEDLHEMEDLLREDGNRIETRRAGIAWSIYLNKVKRGMPNPIVRELRAMDLLKNKHIPEIYMQGSIEQRMELLRGLMDTDGTCSTSGECEFSQKDQHLALQVRELLASLGIKAGIRPHSIMCCGHLCYSYRVLFFTDKEHSCFKLERKKARLKDKLAPRMSAKSIVNIERIPDEASKCIMIDNDTHLYLAGRSYTATHNSEILSALGLYLMIGDHEGGAEVDCVASKRDQAKIVFDEAYHMVEQSPFLSKYIRKRKTDMYSAFNFGKFQPLSSESNTLDGLNPHCGIIDELHSIKDRNIYDTVKQGMSARRQPMMIMITTSGYNRESIYDDMYAYAERVLSGEIKDEHFLPLIYELDKREEWTDPKKWIKANPGLGPIKSRKTLADNVKRAKTDVSFRPTVLTKDFNLKNVTSESWLTYDQLWNPATFSMDEVKDTYAIGGCDLSATTDLTCATLLIRKPGRDNLYVLQQYFLPEDRVAAVEATSSKEAPYRKWADAGFLTLCKGAMVNYADVTAWYVRMRDEYGIDLWRLGYDRALAGYWADDMAANFGASVMEKVAQGPFTWTSPMKELGAMLTDKKINYNANPMLAWCLSNTGVKSSGTVESIQPVKIQQHLRIDGMVSLLNAYVIYTKYRDDYLNTIG